jgi:hypothetical protein
MSNKTYIERDRKVRKGRAGGDGERGIKEREKGKEREEKREGKRREEES